MVYSHTRPVGWCCTGSVSAYMIHYIVSLYLFTCRHTARDSTHSVSGAVLVHYPSQELAEAAFDVALRAGHVEVL